MPATLLKLILDPNGPHKTYLEAYLDMGFEENKQHATYTAEHTQHQIHHPVYRRTLSEICTEALDRYVLLESETEVLGCLTITRNSSDRLTQRITISEIYVKPEYRGVGHAKMMIDMIPELYPPSGGDRGVQVYLSVDSLNKTALGLYTKLGFKTYSTSYISTLLPMPRAQKSSYLHIQKLSSVYTTKRFQLQFLKSETYRYMRAHLKDDPEISHQPEIIRAAMAAKTMVVHAILREVIPVGSIMSIISSRKQIEANLISCTRGSVFDWCAVFAQYIKHVKSIIPGGVCYFHVRSADTDQAQALKLNRLKVTAYHMTKSFTN